MKRQSISFLISAILASQSFADVVTCQPTYDGLPFKQATLWSDMSGFGPAECLYMKGKEKSTYKFPKKDDYYVVSGHWKSTMPGFQWCSIDDGNTAASCRFAKKETEGNSFTKLIG